MKTFITIWFGQLVSQVGTAMTRFALLIWAYEQTGSATTMALLGFFSFLPLIVISPIAGVWIDRLDRRKVMLLADTGAGLMTVALLALYAAGNLQIWHLYLAEALVGVFETFQKPAYTAATSTLLPPSEYTRANGLRSMAEFGAQIAAPILGGLLLSWTDIAVVMVVDLVTFLVAVATLAVVRLPLVAGASQTAAGQATFWQEAGLGFSFIWRQSGLLGFALIMTTINFFATLTWFSILPAMILARSGHNELALASVQSAMGIGGVLGGVLITVWGGPRRKIHGFLLGIVASFVVGDILLAVGRSLPVWVLAAGSGAFCIPTIGSCYEAIWMSKVHPTLQGRVFSARNMVTQLLVPAGYLLAGSLADQTLEPAMAAGGWLAPKLGWLVGVGPGTGIALMFIGSAIGAIVICLGAYLVPAIRRVEEDLPDHDFGLNSIQIRPA